VKKLSKIFEVFFGRLLLLSEGQLEKDKGTCDTVTLFDSQKMCYLNAVRIPKLPESSLSVDV